MIRLHILSDLHLEFLQSPTLLLPDLEADVTILAGDIHSHTNGLLWSAQSFRAHGRQVIYVPGNHEFYSSHIAGLPGQLRKVALRHGIYLLNNSAVVLNGVRFLGCTLWTDFQLNGPGERAFCSMQAAKVLMNDFRIIRSSGGEVFSPEESIRLHHASRTWLQQELAQNFDGPTVVITHHAPHPGSIAERYLGSELSPAFASDLTVLIEKYQPDIWIHGHMHDVFDYQVGKTRIVCNPKGYPGERQHGKFGFSPTLVIEI